MTFTITVPASVSTQAKQRQPLYISSHTEAISIALAASGSQPAQPLLTSPVRFGAPNCTPSALTPPLQCSFTVSAPAGASDAFAIATYGLANGSGPVLASATVPVAVAAGAKQTVALDLDGNVASFAMLPAWIHAVEDGRAHSFVASVIPLDASGAYVVGPSAAGSNVQIRVADDPQSALSLDTSTFANSGLVTVRYDASRPLVHAHLIASAGGVSASADFTPLRSSIPFPLAFTFGGAPKQVELSEDGVDPGAISLSILPIDPGTSGHQAYDSQRSGFTVASTIAGTKNLLTITPPAVGQTFHDAGQLEKALPASGPSGDHYVIVNDGNVNAVEPYTLTDPTLAATEILSPFDGSTTWPDSSELVAAADGSAWLMSQKVDRSTFMVHVAANTFATTAYALPGIGIRGADGTLISPSEPLIVGADGNLYFAAASNNTVTGDGSPLPLICRFATASQTLGCTGNGLTPPLIPQLLRADGPSIDIVANDANGHASLGTYDTATANITLTQPIAPSNSEANLGNQFTTDPQFERLSVVVPIVGHTACFSQIVSPLNLDLTTGIATDTSTIIRSLSTAPNPYVEANAGSGSSCWFELSDGTFASIDAGSGTPQSSRRVVWISNVTTALRARADGKLWTIFAPAYGDFMLGNAVGLFDPTTQTMSRYRLDAFDAYVNGTNSARTIGSEVFPFSIASNGNDAFVLSQVQVHQGGANSPFASITSRLIYVKGP